MSEKRDQTDAGELSAELQVLRRRLRDRDTDLGVLTARLELQSDREVELRRLLVRAHERLVECEERERRLSEHSANQRGTIAVRVPALARFYRRLRRRAR